MKRFILCLAVIAMLCSCRQDNFAIVGSVPIFSDASNLVILKINQKDTIAVAPIQDASFVYRTRVNSVCPCTVRLDDGSMTWNIIMEPGVVELDALNGEFSGTPYNDVLNELQKDLTQKFYSLDRDKYKEYALERNSAFIEEHLNDLMGAYVLMCSASQLDDERIKDFVDRSGPEFRDSEFVSYLRTRVTSLY